MYDAAGFKGKGSTQMATSVPKSRQAGKLSERARLHPACLPARMPACLPTRLPAGLPAYSLMHASTVAAIVAHPTQWKES